MITKKQLERIILNMVNIIKKQAPIRTGNLRSSIRYREVEPLVWEIYVNWGNDPYLRDYKQGIAPYMPFTNEPWISPRWNGRKNPNEGWWERACEMCIEDLKMRTKGVLRKENRNATNK